VRLLEAEAALDLLVEDGPDLADVADRPGLDPLAHPDGGVVPGAVGKGGVAVDVGRLRSLAQSRIHVLHYLIIRLLLMLLVHMLLLLMHLLLLHLLLMQVLLMHLLLHVLLHMLLVMLHLRMLLLAVLHLWMLWRLLLLLLVPVFTVKLKLHSEPVLFPLR